MSDKNLLCIVLTFGLAILAIGNAFRTGNYVLGLETLMIWLAIYCIMPVAMMIDKKVNYKYAPIDLKTLLFKTVQNNYLFISFCASLLLSILFDDFVDFTGHFVKDSPAMDIPVISVLVFLSAFVSISFYYLFSIRRIDKLKKYGTKVDAKVTDIKMLNENCYVKVEAVQPETGEKINLIGITYSEDKSDIPENLPVYFDKDDLENYFFDCCSWIENSK